ncbi:Cytochrome P450, partial [Cucurbita argyrosperma subsp. argyrosperma]
MEYFVFYSLALCLVVFGVAKAFYSIWWRPKLVERQLKRQGVRGSSYKPLVGDAKEYVSMITEAWSTPMNLDHQIIQRVDPFTAVYAKKYGKLSMCWFGTSPRLMGMMPAFTISCSSMIERWKEMAGNQESVEVDVWPEIQRLTADVISRAAFGSNFEEGKKLFELLKQLTLFTVEAMQTLYLPGFRLNFASPYHL